MPSKIKVEVTAGDIKKGKIRASWSCPVALSVIRALKKVFGDKATSIGVCRVVINMTINDGKKIIQYVQDAPKAVAQFISKIDAHDGTSKKNKASVQPFSFLLQIPTLGKKERKKDWYSINTSNFPSNSIDAGDKIPKKKKK